MGVTYSFLLGSRTKKRPLEEDENKDKMRIPVKKKLKTTDYIYDRLFVKGENSDVVIEALGKEWHLHKVYLCQSAYFNAMFSKDWKEAQNPYVHIDVPDQLVSQTSLECAFGSLYRDEISIEPAVVINLVAAASLLQLENLIAQCGEVMVDHLNVKTVIPFLTTGETYGLQNVRNAAIGWLNFHLLEFSSSPTFLHSISCDLMKELVSSSELYVIQGEVDVYSMLKIWSYIQNTGGVEMVNASIKQSVDEYFSAYKTSPECFLESADGDAFQDVFASLRLSHIATSTKSVKDLTAENVFPSSTNKSSVLLQQVHSVLRGFFSAHLTSVKAKMWESQLKIESQFDQELLNQFHPEDVCISYIRY